jgi:hypothetical protein
MGETNMDSFFPKSRKIVDFRAVFWAGIVSGLVFLVVNMLLSWIILGTPWIFVRMAAALLLGQDALPPPASFDLIIFLVALVIHLVLSLVFTTVLASIIHKWGLAVGIIGGALFGLALYAINIYTFSIFFPWFFSLRSWIILLSHLIYGATAGGMYEALEVERFETI